MGEHCVSDRPLSTTQKPTGDISTITDIECYITKPSTYPHNPSKLLLLLTGGTGLKSINNQIQADKYAAEGFLVVMPDMFGGDTPFAPSIVDDSASLLEQIKMKADLVSRGPSVAKTSPRKRIQAMATYSWLMFND